MTKVHAGCAGPGLRIRDLKVCRRCPVHIYIYIDGGGGFVIRTPSNIIRMRWERHVARMLMTTAHFYWKMCWEGTVMKT
jgi:hypothetical protein